MSGLSKSQYRIFRNRVKEDNSPLLVELKRSSYVTKQFKVYQF